MTSERRLQVGLWAASAAAFVILLGLFSDALRLGCLFVVIGVTVASAGVRRRAGGGWWWLLAGAALLSVIGAIVAEAANTTGGWIALIGGILVPVAAAIGYPRGEDEEE